MMGGIPYIQPPLGFPLHDGKASRRKRTLAKTHVVVLYLLFSVLSSKQLSIAYC